MSRLCIGILLLSLCLTKQAVAHEAKAYRSVVAQVDKKKVGILISWIAPTGEITTLIHAKARGIKDPRQRQRNMASIGAQFALKGLTILINGKPVPSRHMEIKIVSDDLRKPLIRRRHAVVLLTTIPLSQKKTTIEIVVARNKADKSLSPTKVRWFRNKTAKATANITANKWDHHTTSLKLIAVP